LLEYGRAAPAGANKKGRSEDRPFALGSRTELDSPAVVLEGQAIWVK